MTLKDFKEFVSSVDSKYDELPVAFNGFYYFGPVAGCVAIISSGKFFQFYFDFSKDLEKCR